MARELTFTIVIEEDTIKELFESADVKYSKKKFDQILEEYDLEDNADIIEGAEDAIKESIEGIIHDEFGE